MDSVKDKVYVVTGLSGIGLSVASLLHAYGARLSLADKDAAILTAAVERINPADPSTIKTTVVDITSSAAVNAWIESTVSHFGRLDGAANMAGTIGHKHGIGKLIDQEDDEWDMLLRVNMTGLMYCLRAELRSILATTGKGSIVNAASIQGLRGFACHAAYSATKHGVVGLSKSAAKEVGENIRINAVAP